MRVPNLHLEWLNEALLGNINATKDKVRMSYVPLALEIFVSGGTEPRTALKCGNSLHFQHHLNSQALIHTNA